MELIEARILLLLSYFAWHLAFLKEDFTITVSLQFMGIFIIK